MSCAVRNLSRTLRYDVSRNEEVNAAVNNIISRFGKADKNPDTPSGVYVFS